MEDVAAGFCEVSELWPDVLEPCAQAIAVASAAIAAVIKILFIPVSSDFLPLDMLPGPLRFLVFDAGTAMAFGLPRCLYVRQKLY